MANNWDKYVVGPTEINVSQLQHCIWINIGIGMVNLNIYVCYGMWKHTQIEKPN